MNKPNFYDIEPLSEHNCMFCQHKAYEIGKGIVCQKRKIAIATLEHVRRNDCTDYLSVWQNDFKYQQRYGKNYEKNN